MHFLRLLLRAGVSSKRLLCSDEHKFPKILLVRMFLSHGFLQRATMFRNPANFDAYHRDVFGDILAEDLLHQ
ncbi:hypothetical protein TELCIR_22530 [Teladorsagia circumcincta]|uniref:Uncharacterized protein n=1 Tax=Teladorsagia circumcincta TaxID=45464 RepID=A0A2G9TDM2_TELCI|nr:hypothetical protein TELCIR_22530 [Teladorsagia circumcincta]